MMVALDSSLGIEFGEEHLLLVHLKKLVRQVIVSGHEFISLPAAMQEQEADLFLTQEVSRFVKEQKAGKENVWVSLPLKDCALRVITLPASAEENLREVVRYELGKYFPFSDEEINVDFLILARDASTRTISLLLMAVKKKTIERYLSILQGVGISPLGIEMHSSALINFFLLGTPNPETRPCALLSLDKNRFELDWVTQHTLRYSRAVGFVQDADTERAQEVLAEIRKSFRSAFPGEALDEVHESEDSPIVYLTGHESEGGLTQHLLQLQNPYCEMLPLHPISSRLNLSNEFPQALTSGIGLAVKGIQKVPWDVNLLPLQLRKKIRKAGVYISFALVLLLSVLTVTWGVSIFVKERLVLRKAEREIAALQKDVAAVQKLQKEAEAICAKVEGLENIQQSEFNKLETLQELSRILPPTVWLTNFRYYKKDLDLAGYAASASDLIALLDGSPRFSASEFTAPITRDREGVEAFKIKTKIETK